MVRADLHSSYKPKKLVVQLRKEPRPTLSRMERMGGTRLKLATSGMRDRLGGIFE